MNNVEHNLQCVLLRKKSDTNLLYQHQVDQAFLWIEKCSQNQISKLIKLLFTRSCLSTKRYFCTILEPLLHRDYIYHDYESFQTPFKSLSSFVTREKHKKLEQELQKNKKETVKYFRMKSAHITDEADLKHWSDHCILPSVKSEDKYKVSVAVDQQKKFNDVVLPKIKNNPTINSTKNLVRCKSEVSQFKKRRGIERRRNNTVPLFDENCIRVERRHLQDAKIMDHKMLVDYKCSVHPDKEMTGHFFKQQAKKLLRWFPFWSREQQEDFLRMFINKMDNFQLYYVYGFLLVRLSCDFTQILPEDISLKIFGFLKPFQLKICCKVNRYWQELCSHDAIWKKICAKRNIPLFNKASYMKAFYYSKAVERNWVDSKPSAVTEHAIHQSSILAIDIYDDRLLATGSVDKSIKVWCLKFSEPLAILEGHSKAVWDLKFLSENILISCSGDHSIKIWNVARSSCVRSMNGHENSVWCLKVDGDLLFSGSADRTVKMWNLRSGKVLSTYEPHPGGVYSIAIADDHSRLFAGTVDKTIRVWDLTAPGLCLETLHVETSRIASFPIINLSTLIPGYLFSCCANSFQLWHVSTSKIVKIYKDVHKERITCADVLYNEKGNCNISEAILDEENSLNVKIITTSKDGKLRVWKLQSNTPVQNLTCNEIGNVLFSTRTGIYVGTHPGILKTYSFA